MPIWTDEDHLRFDIAFALSKLKVRAKPPDEQQRKMAAEQNHRAPKAVRLADDDEEAAAQGARLGELQAGSPSPGRAPRALSIVRTPPTLTMPLWAIFFIMPLLAARSRRTPSSGCKVVTHHKLGALFLLVLVVHAVLLVAQRRGAVVARLQPT